MKYQSSFRLNIKMSFFLISIISALVSWGTCSFPCITYNRNTADIIRLLITLCWRWSGRSSSYMQIKLFRLKYIGCTLCYWFINTFSFVVLSLELDAVTTTKYVWKEDKIEHWPSHDVEDQSPFTLFFLCR